jgi:hypothetical protein
VKVPKYEYKVCHMLGQFADVEPTINSLAQEGWRVVSSFTTTDGYSCAVILERPRAEVEE